MTRRSRIVTFAVMSILGCSASAYAETMSCQSVNGNLNCAGSGGVSCQTINGKKTCTSGNGNIVQSFGSGTSSNTFDYGAETDDEDMDNARPVPSIKQRLEQHGPGGHTLLLERDGTKLHLRTNGLSIDRD